VTSKLSWMGRALLVFLLGAAALHVLTRLSAPEPAPSAPGARGADRHGAADATMRARVDLLERRMAQLPTSRPGPGRPPATGAADAERADSKRAADGRVDENHMSAEEETAVLGKMYEAQQRDPAWADDREAHLRSLLAERLPQAAASDVSCRASMCRIVVEHADAAASSAFRSESGGVLIGDFAALHLGDLGRPDGRNATEVLLFRDLPPRDVRLRRR